MYTQPLRQSGQTFWTRQMQQCNVLTARGEKMANSIDTCNKCNFNWTNWGNCQPLHVVTRRQRYTRNCMEKNVHALKKSIKFSTVLLLLLLLLHLVLIFHFVDDYFAFATLALSSSCATIACKIITIDFALLQLLLTFHVEQLGLRCHKLSAITRLHRWHGDTCIIV